MCTDELCGQAFSMNSLFCSASHMMSHFSARHLLVPAFLSLVFALAMCVHYEIHTNKTTCSGLSLPHMCTGAVVHLWTCMHPLFKFPGDRISETHSSCYRLSLGLLETDTSEGCWLILNGVREVLHEKRDSVNARTKRARECQNGASFSLSLLKLGCCFIGSRLPV